MKNNYLFILLLTFSLLGFSQISIVQEINDSGTLSSSPANLTVFNGLLYFNADDSSGNTAGADYGRELWTCDGTNVNFVKDINSGTSAGSPSNFFEYGGALYFSANSGGGSVLHVTDGTEMGTTATGDPGVFFPVELDNVVYFINTLSSNTLWQFTGPASSVAVAGSGSENAPGGEMTTYGNKLLLYMDTAAEVGTVGRELYEYDPATDTFALIKDIAAGTANSGISNFVALNGEIYFEATGKVWKTDGTELGTVEVTNASSINSTANYFSWNNKLFFEGDDGTGDQLWVYDPIADTVTNLSQLSGTNVNHDPSDYVAFGDFLYYRGEDSNDTDGHIWRTDGVEVLQIDSSIIDIDELTLFDGDIYFEGDNGSTGNELYRLETSTLSITQVTNSSVSIFPNPSKNEIKIEGLSGSVFYSITDLNGRQIQEGSLIENTINHDLASGVYLLNLKQDNSNIVKKIVVE